MDRLHQTKGIIFPSETRYIREVVSQMVDFVSSSQGDNRFWFSMALSEALANTIIHGNRQDPSKKVFVKVTVGPQKITFKIADEGAGFDYRNLPNPRIQPNLLKENGRGLFIIRYIMDEVHFNEIGNEITMIKYKN